MGWGCHDEVLLLLGAVGFLLLIVAGAYAYVHLTIRAPVVAFQILLFTFFAVYERTPVFSTNLSSRLGGSVTGEPATVPCVRIVYTPGSAGVKRSRNSG